MRTRSNVLSAAKKMTLVGRHALGKNISENRLNYVKYGKKVGSVDVWYLSTLPVPHYPVMYFLHIYWHMQWLRTPINMMLRLPPPRITWGITGPHLNTNPAPGVGYLNCCWYACAQVDHHIRAIERIGRKDGACEHQRKQAHCLLFKHA